MSVPKPRTPRASARVEPSVARPRRRVVLALGLVLAGLGLLALATPEASALHLSVGASDAIGVAPTEEPGDPSVEPAWYDVGTRDPEECYQPDPNAPTRTRTETEAALSKEGFCGKLVYEPGTIFQRLSPEDQHLPGDEVGLFDGMVVTYVGNHQFQTCIPWCYPPGGQHAYESLHTVGAELGWTDGGERAFQRDGGWQEYAVNLALPNPVSLVDDNVGTHPMNGWIFPVWDQTMVAFLEDRGGNPIDERELQALVAELVARGELPPASVPRVCGFTPDADVRPMNAPTSFCEVEFRWVDEEQTAEPDASASGPCRSATYLCGAFHPHWQAEVTCAFVLANCGSPATEAEELDAFVWENEDGDDNIQRDEEGSDRGRTRNSDPPASADSTLAYVRWHFVVAAAPTACNGLVDPGFALDPGLTGTSRVYLAHDLDVYTPLAHLATGPPEASSFTNLRDWGQAHVHGLTGQGRDRWPDPGRSGGTTDLPIEETRRHAAKDRLAEPNAANDTSQSHVRIDRGNACTRVADTPETEATQDPWVDIVDARVLKTGQGTGAYGNDRADQDAGNRPGPGWFTTRGMVGVFTDPDDDGAYEQAPPSGVFSEIFDVGAYPMFWDMHLAPDGTLAPARGCELDDRSLTEMMSEAGYGQRTGLIQLVLLHEGSDWFYRDDPTWLEHENIIGIDGDASSTAPNAYLFMSQGLWQLHERGSLDGLVDDLRDLLPGDEHDLVASTEMLAPPEGGRSDFYGQCGEGSGGFTSHWDFTHHCLEAEFADCSGDTVLTAYVYENEDPDNVIGGAGGIPAFRPTGWRAFDGLTGGVWIDVDPLDNDPDRNTEGGAPPTGS